jgi:transcription elongation factor GreA
VIDVTQLNPGSRVVFGAIVDLEDEDTGAAVTYQIVGDLEADIKLHMIAVSSPIARALIGKNEGDSFEFTAPNGVKHYEITGVRYS